MKVEYRNTKIGMLPMRWNIAAVNELGIDVIDGDRGREYPKNDELRERGHCLFLSAKNVTKSGFAFDDCIFVTKERDERLGKGKLEINDIVITTRGTVGNIVIYDSTIPYDNVRINSGMAIFRSRSSCIDTEFLYTLLRSHVIRAC